MRCALLCLLVGQAVALDKVDVQIKAIEEEEAQIKALEEEIGAIEAKPQIFLEKKIEEPVVAEITGPTSTLMISVTETDVDQVALRLSKLIKAQNHKFSGGKWFIYDNNGAKPSMQMRQVMEKAMADQHVDGWLEVDYSPEGLSNLYQKVGMRFAPNAPEGNLAHYWMMDQCQTEYCAHYDLSVVSYAEDGYSWVDRSINVMDKNKEVMQVVSSTPPTKARELINSEAKGSLLESTASFTASSCQQVMTEAHEYKGNSFITGRMYLMHKARYQSLLPISGPTCKRSDLPWEGVMSCESCQNNLKRASLNEGNRGWHLDFPAHAGKQLERALYLVDQGVAVTSKLLPHRAAAIELWEKQDNLEDLEKQGKFIPASK